MTIIVYNYNDDPRRLDKTNYFTAVQTHTATAANDEIDIITPQILVHANQITGNYAKINDLGGYYWIKEKTVVRQGLTLLSLKRDPAMTFLSGILNAPCICARNQNSYDSAFPDNRYPVIQRKTIETKALYTLGNSDSIVFAFVE